MNTHQATAANDFAQLLIDLENVPSGSFLQVVEGDALYLEPAAVWIRPATQFDDPEAIAAKIGHPYSTITAADFYTLDGQRVTKADRYEGWWAEQVAITPMQPARVEHNAIHRFGNDYIIVGRGVWYVTAETTVDGERAFETISADERDRRRLEKLESLMPAVIEAKPHWADDPTVAAIDDDPRSGSFAVSYLLDGFLSDGEVPGAEVRLEQWVTFDRASGDVTARNDVQPYVLVTEASRSDEYLSPAQLTTFADAVRNMAAKLAEIRAVA